MAQHVQIPAFDEAITYTVTTAQSEFAIPFPFWAAADIIVEVDGVALATSAYTVAGVFVQDGDPVEGAYGSGTVTLDVAVEDCTVTIDRMVEAIRETDFAKTGAFSINTLNSDLDKLTARDQDITRRVDGVENLVDRIDPASIAAAASSAGAIAGAASGATAGATSGGTAGAGAAEAVLTSKLDTDGGNVGASAGVLRTALGLGDSATLNVGTTAGTVAAGDDSRIAASALAPSLAPYWDPSGSKTRTIVSGTSDSLHRHFGGIAVDAGGAVHIAYRRGAVHAVSGDGSIIYTRLDNGGVGTPTEEVVAAPDAGRDLRDCAVIVTPTGRIIVFFTDRSDAGVDVAYFKETHKDPGDAAWSTPTTIKTLSYDFCGFFGQPKIIPDSSVASGYRILKPGYYQSGATNYISGLWESADDGDSWTEGTPIYTGTGGYNETAIEVLNDQVIFACPRGTGLNWVVSTDGGATWGTLQTISWDGANYVSPSLNIIYRKGEPWLLLGYCERSSNTTQFRWAKAEDCMTDAEAFINARSNSAADMVNASGYQSGIIDGKGQMIYVEFKEYDPETYSDVRLVFAQPLRWINDIRLFTPLLGSTGGGTPVYTTQYGKAEKNGQTVRVEFSLAISSKGTLAAGQLKVSGFPFPIRGNATVTGAAFTPSFINNQNFPAGTVGLIGYGLNAGYEVRFNRVTLTGIASLLPAEIDDDFVLAGEIAYQTDA